MGTNPVDLVLWKVSGGEEKGFEIWAAFDALYLDLVLFGVSVFLDIYFGGGD